VLPAFAASLEYLFAISVTDANKGRCQETVDYKARFTHVIAREYSEDSRD